jgi:hypothetical protein
VVAGKVVHGDGKFRPLAPPMPRPSSGWSPVGRHWPDAAAPNVPTYRSASNCCAAPCLVHGHRHRFAALAPPPVCDRRAFWGAAASPEWPATHRPDQPRRFLKRDAVHHAGRLIQGAVMRPVALRIAARASRRVESSVGSAELSSLKINGISVHPSTTASQPLDLNR